MRVLKNYVSYCIELLRNKPEVLKSLKITLNGFDLGEIQEPILHKLAENIKGAKDNIKTLWFHTSNLANVTLKDFSDLFGLCFEMADINF